ncbi:unnamed protein product [Linum tenue]|uniref:Uncharacterized protein n=2 Tax=Linum tenue TaxID=586396 RepID=A0AAV0ICS6_9ROSI|nr:unnamed protein product [Linum tenue]
MAAGREPFNMSPRPTTSHETNAAMAAAERSPWHSPVPYLFGGLAAMLGLIAFALLILACSYWKLSGYLENDGERDLEAGEGEGNGKEGGEGGEKKAKEFDEKFLVIMAGQVKPTYLATQVSSRSLSFGDGEKPCLCGEKDGKLEGGKQGSDEEQSRDNRGISREGSGESSSSSSSSAAATSAATAAEEEETVAPH